VLSQVRVGHSENAVGVRESFVALVLRGSGHNQGARIEFDDFLYSRSVLQNDLHKYRQLT
jgi:hypothetical protein